MIHISINGITLPILVDTGSAATLLDSNLYYQICKIHSLPSLLDNSNVICGLGGKSLSTLGYIDLSIDSIGLVKFLIVHDLGYKAILGSDALELGNACFDFESNFLTWFGQPFELFSCPDSITIGSISTSITGDPPQLLKLLDEYSDIISKPGQYLKATKLVECTIPTACRPIRQRAYRTPLAKRQIISDQIDDMLAQKIIRPSSSPWASPITLVPKKNGELRFCCDLRKLNANTIKDAFPLPLIQDIFDQLQGARIFSTLDLKTGYWQIPIAPADIPKTAFICHRGLFEFLRMPYGLSNGPAVFQRTMQRVLHGLIGVSVFCYIYDVVVFSKDREEHLLHLKQVFDRFRKYSLTIKPSKCKFFCTSVLLLGYIISADGISANPDKVAAIVNLAPPTKVTEVRTFLGMTGYYRQLVPNYADIARPLTQLTKKGQIWDWSKNCQVAFEKLKQVLSSDTVLAYPRTDLPYKLYCDASNYAVGAILVQTDENEVERVVHYLSHTLDSTQVKWSTIVKEAYAIVYALQKLRPYLWGATFEIITDHKPLKSLFSQEIANSKIQRWAVQIAEFGAPIRYKCGQDNARADMLSRVRSYQPLSVLTVEWSLPLDFDHIERCELIREQKREFLHILNTTKNDKNYVLQEGILMSLKRPGIEHAEYPRVLLPTKWRRQVINNRHEQAGHAQSARILYHIQQCYVWPGMVAEVKNVISRCGTCRMFISQKEHVHLNRMPEANFPFQIISVDLVGPLPRSQFGHTYLFTLICHLTCWADVFPIAHKTGETISKILADRYFPQYGIPEIMISDNGKEFANEEVESLLKQFGVKHNFTTPYHPRSNGKIERLNKTFKSILKKLMFSAKTNWEQQIGPALMAYRNTFHTSAGFTPFQALYGRTGRCPRQVSHGISNDQERMQTLYSTWKTVKENLADTRDENERLVCR